MAATRSRSGIPPLFFSEFYQPLDESLVYFIAPRIEYRSWNINNFSEGVLFSQYRATQIEGGLDVGRQFGNWGQIRLGLRRGYGNVGVRVGPPAAGGHVQHRRDLHLRFLQPARQLQLSPPGNGRRRHLDDPPDGARLRFLGKRPAGGLAVGQDLRPAHIPRRPDRPERPEQRSPAPEQLPARRFPEPLRIRPG